MSVYLEVPTFVVRSRKFTFLERDLSAAEIGLKFIKDLAAQAIEVETPTPVTAFSFSLRDSFEVSIFKAWWKFLDIALGL